MGVVLSARRSRKATCERDVQFGSPSDEAGFTSMWARLYAPDAVVLKARVEQMARSVCEDDPRTLGERRSDALTAVAAGIAELACECGGGECAAAGRPWGCLSLASTPIFVHLMFKFGESAGSRAKAPPMQRSAILFRDFGRLGSVSREPQYR